MHYENVQGHRDVLFEYHRAVVPFCWAVKGQSNIHNLVDY